MCDVDKKEFMTVRETSDLLGIPKGFIYRALWAVDGDHIDYGWCKHTIRIPAIEFDKLIGCYKNRRRPSTSDDKAVKLFKQYLDLDSTAKQYFEILYLREKVK